MYSKVLVICGFGVVHVCEWDGKELRIDFRTFDEGLTNRIEARYGMPAADHILYNRHHIIGCSYYFRQAKWALEIVDNTNVGIERLDNFRPDYRISENFRADLTDFRNSGFDRGHLVASANQIGEEIQNSETF